MKIGNPGTRSGSHLGSWAAGQLRLQPSGEDPIAPSRGGPFWNPDEKVRVPIDPLGSVGKANERGVDGVKKKGPVGLDMYLFPTVYIHPSKA